MKSHSQVPGTKTSTYVFGVTIQPTTKTVHTLEMDTRKKGRYGLLSKNKTKQKNQGTWNKACMARSSLWSSTKPTSEPLCVIITYLLTHSTNIYRAPTRNTAANKAGPIPAFLEPIQLGEQLAGRAHIYPLFLFPSEFGGGEGKRFSLQFFLLCCLNFCNKHVINLSLSKKKCLTIF